MDLSQFQKSAVAGKKPIVKKTSNPIKRTYLSLKDWLYPNITTLRQQRMNQYKDLGIFLGAVLAVAYFEDKIKNFL
jgi:hypothetical protein